MLTKTHHHQFVDFSTCQYVWEEEELEPFNELILSWNTPRPEKGHYSFSIALKTEEWSSFVDYANWGQERQRSFHSGNYHIESYQDMIKPKNGKATGFKIRVEEKEGAQFSHFFYLHASLSRIKEFQSLTMYKVGGDHP